MKRISRSAATRPSIAPAEALEILSSAVNYCQQSGLTVRVGNVDGKLALVIDGAHVASNGAMTHFIAGNLPMESACTATEVQPD